MAPSLILRNWSVTVAMFSFVRKKAWKPYGDEVPVLASTMMLGRSDFISWRSELMMETCRGVQRQMAKLFT